VLKIAEASLIFCVTAAVLAFGGTEPISFAVVEIVLLGAVLAVLIRSKYFNCSHCLARYCGGSGRIIRWARLYREVTIIPFPV
jgi:hypothetical protein